MHNYHFHLIWLSQRLWKVRGSIYKSTYATTRKMNKKKNAICLKIRFQCHAQFSTNTCDAGSWKKTVKIVHGATGTLLHLIATHCIYLTHFYCAITILRWALIVALCWARINWNCKQVYRQHFSMKSINWRNGIHTWN